MFNNLNNRSNNFEFDFLTEPTPSKGDSGNESVISDKCLECRDEMWREIVDCQ